MEYTLEVIPLPVSDLDRSMEFYRDKLGFHVDIDAEVMPGMRIVQLTPPGSGCSIALAADSLWDTMSGPKPPAGSYQGLQLCVADAKAAHAELTSRGLDISEPIQHSPEDGGTFMYFKDPDGNGWAIQEYTVRAKTPLRDAIVRQG